MKFLHFFFCCPPLPMAEIASDDLEFDVATFFSDDLTFDFDFDLSKVTPPTEDAVSPSPKSTVDSPTSSWMNELEQFLLGDEEVSEDELKVSDPSESFFADVFVREDGKGLGEASGVDEQAVVEEKSVIQEEKEREIGVSDAKSREEDDENVIDKKRMRQLRNRDSAMKSRERRKIYVQNLERKSKFLETECKRLEHLLSCCKAENITLQQRLLKDRTSGLSRAKQESAVLFEESLPLGSLFWLVMAVFLFLVPNLLAWILAVGLIPEARGHGVSQKVETMGTKNSGNERLNLGIEYASVFMRRRYRAMKPKLKILPTCF